MILNLILAMSTIGYGDITAQNEVEQAFALVAMLVGSLMYAYGITNLCSILYYFKQYEMQFEVSFDRLFDYFERHSIPMPLRLKLQKYISWKFNQEPHEYGPDSDLEKILDPLSTSMKNSLLSATVDQAFPSTDSNSHRHISNKILLFNIFGPKSRFKGHFASYMHARTFSAGEIVQSSLKTINALSGTVAFISTGRLTWYAGSRTYEIYKGSTLNLTSAVLLTMKHKPNFNDMCVIAKTNCLMYTISFKEIRAILTDWPFLRSRLEKYLKVRVERKLPDFIRTEETSWSEFVESVQRDIGISSDLKEEIFRANSIRDLNGSIDGGSIPAVAATNSKNVSLAGGGLDVKVPLSPIELSPSTNVKRRGPSRPDENSRRSSTAVITAV